MSESPNVFMREYVAVHTALDLSSVGCDIRPGALAEPIFGGDQAEANLPFLM